MAKAESGLRQRIKAALEADGWCVLTQHGSAYSPNIPDLLVVRAALEVKTETGHLRPGQQSRMRRLVKQGVPTTVVHSVPEAMEFMRLVAKGVPMVGLDLSFLDNLGAPAPAEQAAEQDADDLDQRLVPPADDTTQADRKEELMGLLLGQSPGMTPAVAEELVQTEFFEPAPEPEPTYEDVACGGLQPGRAAEYPYTSGSQVLAAQKALGAVTPAGNFGILEGIVDALDQQTAILQGISDTLSDFMSGFTGAEPRPARATAPRSAPQPEDGGGPPKPRRHRRTKAEMEAARAYAASQAVNPYPLEDRE